MTDLSGYQLETLRNDGEFALYRGWQAGNAGPILVLAPIAEPPAPGILERLEHEYSLAGELDPEWSAQPLMLARQDGRTVLVLADPGCDPFDGFVGRPVALTRFLRIAIGVTSALCQVHRRGLIHKDIKPANLLVDTAGNVRLTGFGIASRLPRERQAPEPPEVVTGTFAYMAPEQTGRMNRSIDARSDLYSLGVTLYEMLTGVLPFAASDPMEWIHCHIARQPIAPSDRAVVPAQLSAIVMKLLAKTAEERYQTAAAVETDLRRCLTEWEAHGRIDPFPFGEHDISDRLLIPEKLYGREREIQALLDAFGRVATGGESELVLVSGYSGIGKSSIVNELRKSLVSVGGLFASGKFDQYRRDIPYATLAQAFQHLVRQLLGKNDAELDRWRQALQEALSPNGQLMVNLIPELVLVIGEQAPVPELPPQDAQNRFHLVFRRFLGVFAQPEHPLTLFLDDLQWLDTATLELLERLVTEPEVRHLLLIGAYRDNEVPSTHPLSRTLESIRRGGGTVYEIVLAPLIIDDVERLVAEALHAERENARSLAELVFAKTSGNPFFLIQFVTALADEGLLTFNPEAAVWAWDLSRIRSKGYTDNVADLMAGKLDRLPHKSRKAMGLLACLGNAADSATLISVHGESDDALHAALWEAVRAGLVCRSDTSYAFVHDRMWEAAYQLIPLGERAAVHLKIGRILSSRLAPAEIEERTFEIVSQFNRGADLIHSLEERERVAKLNLAAGARAKGSTAYTSALTYLAAGRALLAEDSWSLQRRLTFDLELCTAECEFLTGELGAAEGRLLALADRATRVIDRAATARLLMALYTTLGQPDRAIEVGLEYLSHIGINWSRHPTTDAVRWEYDRVWQQIGRREIEALANLPVMNNPDSRATIDVLTDLVCPALYVDEKLSFLAVGRVTNLSLEYGNSEGSCVAYAYSNMAIGALFGDYLSGFRFGKLGFGLVEGQAPSHSKARVYMTFGNLVIPWTKHVRTGQPFVRRAFDIALGAGDLTYASFCCNHLITNLIASGEALADTQREAEKSLDFVRKAKFGFVTDAIIAQLALIRYLRGEKPSFASFNHPDFDESRFEQYLEEDPNHAIAACWYWIRKLQARFYAEDNASAIDAASKAQTHLRTSPSFLEGAEYHFFSALARAAHYNKSSTAARAEHLEAIVAHHKTISTWAEHCPENFENRAALVAGEIARIEGRELEAERLYEEAIRSARKHGFIHNEAIAHELAGRFYAARGFEIIADTYLRNARSCYVRWGADGKVRQLDQRYPHLRQELAAGLPTGTIIASIGQLDLATVLKMSQAVSSENILDELVERLLVLAVESAGAERCLLILPRADQQRIEAEATILGDTVGVQLRQAPVTPADLPQSVLRYTIRTQDSVILDDALCPNEFSGDEYFHKARVRSVLCLPLVKQAKLIGVLYLENSLTPNVFTPSRTEVLKLLASQAAISLENDRLNTDLQHAQADLLRAARLTTMGELAASVAHEVNQPLMAIATNAAACLQWLSNERFDLDQAREAAGRVIRNSHHAGEVTRSIYALAKKSPPEMMRLDMNGAIGEILELLRAELRRHDISLETDLRSDLPPVMGDRVQLQQVILNLIMNGIEAMSTIVDRPQRLRVSSRSEETGGVLIAVEDSGPGLDPVAVDRIFDPLFSTKPGGLGLGLSICRSVVGAHGGRVWASQNKHFGSTFQFVLPADRILIDHSA